jgi:hypothetical protein
MAQKTGDVDLLKAKLFDNLEAETLTFKVIEDDDEKRLRLHKERWGFYLKDLSVWALAPVFIAGAWFVCLWMISGNGWSPVEKERAWVAFTSITTGAVGVYFGKQMGK